MITLKKLSAIAASTLLAGMTLGVAAAANAPDTFIPSGSPSVAMVYGANAPGMTDANAAGNIKEKLAEYVSSSGGDTTVSGGESFKIEKTSTKFHLGDYIGNITTSSIDEDEMPTLLARGKYLDSNNEEKDYSQKIDLDNASVGAIQLKMFNDNNYAKDEPTLGFKLTNNQHILNYTLDFGDKPAFDKIETTNLPIMGKEYYVLEVNSANTSITLLDSASTTILEEGNTVVLDGKEVSLTYVASTEVKLSVDGETTNSLAEAQTYKLSDGSYVGIKDIMYSAKDTGVSQVEFSIGSGKLKIQHAQKVEINDEDVRNVYGFIKNSSNTLLDDIVLQWTANDETFLTADQEIVMPGFDAVKLVFGGMNFPAEETFTVEASGNDNVELSNFPIQGGAIDVPILGKAAGNNNYTYIGSDTDELLVTSANTTLQFDGSSNSNDEMFVASWNDGRDAESVLVRFTGFNDPSSGDDTVDVEFNDGSGWTKRYDDSESSDTISYGNVELTLTNVTSTTSSERVIVTAGTDVVFDEIYSAEGLMVQLPYLNTTDYEVASTTPCPSAAVGELQYFNVVNAINNSLIYNVCQSSTYDLVMYEEDKDDDTKVGGIFNVTIGNNGASNYYASVTDVNNASSTREKDETDVYESWKYSALATKFVEDDSGDQDYITVVYHGGESTADLYLTSSDASVSTGAGADIMVVTDSEVATSAANKKLVVVGGSCINSVAAQLVGGAKCEGDFTSATGVGPGEFMIKGYTSGINGKFALLVAGYEAADTTAAATYLIENIDSVDVSKSWKGTTVNSAVTEVTTA